MEKTAKTVDITLIEPRDLVDKFLSDVLLPSTKQSVRSNEMYRWYLQYCEHIELGPCTIAFFSRHLKKRLQHRYICGGLEFFCMLKPELASKPGE